MGRITPPVQSRLVKLLPFSFEYPLIAYCLFALWIEHHVGLMFNWAVVFNFHAEMHLILYGIPWLLVVGYFYQRVVLDKPFTLVIMDFKQDLLRLAGDRRRWIEILRILIAIKLCQTIHFHIKQAIPLINPHLYDTQLTAIDRMLHWGFEPAFTALPSLGWKWLIASVDFLYVFWFLILVPITLYFVINPDPRERRHFFTCYFLLWMIGGGLAVLYPSLGPVYIRPEIFAPLNGTTAHKLQQMLWTHYQQLLQNPANYKAFAYEGIAAFPSFHVGIIVLYTVFLKRYAILFRVLAVYSAVILFGSFFLGWHYVIDGYVAIILVLTIFYATRPFFYRPLPPDHTPKGEINTKPDATNVAPEEETLVGV